MEITNYCNLNCCFCKINNRPQKFVSEDEFEEIITKIKPHTSYVYMHVLGEPLLHNDIGKLLDICDKYDIKSSITTNATLIKERENDLCNKPALRQINYSLHSLFQDKTRNYRQTISNIISLIAKTNNIYHCFRLWNFESGDEEENHIILKELFSYFGVSPPQGITSGNGVKIASNVFIQQQRQFIWPDINNKKIFNSGNCGALKHNCAILVDGSVVPCCLDANGDLILGNIYDDTNLQKILSSQRAENMRYGFSRNEIKEDFCRSCGFHINK